jgi:hypothetical protein
VYLPDGRHPDNEVEPHYGSIVVAPIDIVSSEGWPAQEEVDRGTFYFNPSTISIEGMESAGTVDDSLHDGLLPELRRLAPGFVLDPAAAQTIARLEIRQGTLQAFQVPLGTAAMTQLEVPHDGSITISVTPDDGLPVRTIQLHPGTEIAVANMARGGYDAVVEENGHFQIYGKLSAQPIDLSEPPAVADLPPTPSEHALFRRANPIGLSTSCSNTGCCRP